MNDLEREIFEANQHTYQDNVKLTAQQKDEVQALIRQEISSELSSIKEQQKVQSDFMKASSDPSRPNFKEMVEVGANLVKNNTNLCSGFSQAENKPEFLYELGVRESAYQRLGQQQNMRNHPQPSTTQHVQPEYSPQPILPEPQQSSAPFVPNSDYDSIPWGSLSEEQFIKYGMQMGANFN